MESQFSPSSQILLELLNLNPWAVQLWKKKNELVFHGIWNLQYHNQAGNRRTSEWLDEFRSERKAATRSRLEGPKSLWDHWSVETSKSISPLRERSESSLVRVGSGIRSDEMPEYTIGSLWADIHLLADADLSKEKFHKALDISGYIFPAALLAGGMETLKTFHAQSAEFGDHTTFAMGVFRDVTTFQNTKFGNWTGFVGAEFCSAANFENAKFGFEGSFTGAGFLTTAKFNNALFEGTAPFCGANFRGRPDFSNARFMGRTDFGAATFAKGADFDDTWFPDNVVVHGVSEDVVDAIRNADHSKSRSVN